LQAGGHRFDPGTLHRQLPALTTPEAARKLPAWEPGPSVPRLAVAYAALWALSHLVGLLPGSNPWLLIGLGIRRKPAHPGLARLAAFTWLGARLGFGLFTALGSVVFLGLTGPIGVAEILFVILCLAQAVVLLFPKHGRRWGSRGCAA
jgi:hypothetical protein